MRAFVTTTILAATVVAPALAADAIVDLPPEPVAVAAPFTWSGFYAGVQLGGAFGEIEGANGITILDSVVFGGLDTVTTGFNVDADGFVGGVHAGYNAQFGSFVLGAYADIDYVNLDIATPGVTVFDGDPLDIDLDADGYVARALLKAGVAFDRALVYAQSGVAYIDADLDFTLAAPTFDDVIPTAGSGGFSETGYAIGAGVDFAVTDRIVLGADYLYHDFGTVDVRLPGAVQLDGLDAFDATTAFDLDVHTVRAKLSFKF